MLANPKLVNLPLANPMDKLLKYNYLTNKKYINFLLEHPFDEGYTLLSHILNAQHIWNERIVSKVPEISPWQVLEPSTWESINTTNYTQSMDIIVGVDLSKVISYTNSQNALFTNSIKDIMHHVVNHSSYHRGQIASKATQLGLKPPATDYILFARSDW